MEKELISMSDAKDKSKLQWNKDLIREIAEVLDETGLSEIEYEENDRRIRLVKHSLDYTYAQQPMAYGAQIQMPQASPATAPAASAPAPIVVTEKAEDCLKSPMVGTAYLAAEPGAQPFVTVGQTVSQGQTVLIIEAMKVMNAIKAHKAGTVRRIDVTNGQPVEYNQTMVVIE